MNITVPDEIATDARNAGINVSQVASQALADELDRRAKVAALDAYLDELEHELGAAAEDEQREADAWAAGLRARVERARAEQHRSA